MLGGCSAGFWQLHTFLNSSTFTALGGRAGNLQCHLFKENKKEKWPAYLLSCWLQFSSSLLCFQAHESLGREEKKGTESTKPQQKSRVWFPDSKPSKVRLPHCITPRRGSRQSEAVYLRSHMSTVMRFASSECWSALVRNPSRYRARLDALIKPHLLPSLYFTRLTIWDWNDRFKCLLFLTVWLSTKKLLEMIKYYCIQPLNVRGH